MKTINIIVLVTIFGAAILLFCYKPWHTLVRPEPDNRMPTRAENVKSSARDERTMTTLPKQDDDSSSSAQGVGTSSQVVAYNLPTFSDHEQELKFYKDCAYRMLGGNVDIPNPYGAKVEVQGDDIVVTFPNDEPVKVKKGYITYPESTFRAKVRFNRMTGKLAPIIVGP